jgi:hypothetical protein
MAKQSKEITLVSVAILDENNFYQGLEFVAEKALTKNHIEVPADCDLAKGGYAWLPELKSFVPTEAFIKQQRKNRRGR